MKSNNKRIKIPITKYNPIFRNELSGYTKEDWTSISDIGKIYNGIELTFEEYIKIETLYVEAFFLILKFFNSNKVKIKHIFKLDKKKDFNKYDSIKLYPTYIKLHNDTTIIDTKEIENMIRLRLRENISEIELQIDTKSKTEILFGFDYYMYLETNIEVNLLLSQIRSIGLYTG